MDDILIIVGIIGFALSELLPYLPCKSNGLVQLFIEVLKTVGSFKKK